MGILDSLAWFDSHPGVLVLMLAWTLVWKGLALWRAARLKDPIWFVVFLIVNTVGLLEIIYLYLISKSAKDAE